MLHIEYILLIINELEFEFPPILCLPRPLSPKENFSISGISNLFIYLFINFYH